MKNSSILLITAALFLSSCNMPGTDAQSPDVVTAAALTVEAAINDQSPLATSTVDSESEPVATENSNDVPFARFEDVTNCRTGPGVNYDRITQITPGLSVEIVGFFPPNYWIVQTDAGPCWVAGQLVTPSGNTSAIPTVIAPPTPKTESLQGVSLQKWDVACNYATNEAQVTIIWSDEENEAGYRVIRNDTVVAELPADVTLYKETITLLSGQTAGYSIIAFNGAGQTQSKTITLGC